MFHSHLPDLPARYDDTPSAQLQQGAPPPKLTLFSSSQLSSPTSTVLQQLYNLNQSSSQFNDQLHNVLHSEVYKHSLLSLQGNDLLSLVDYLDKVCCCISIPCSPSEPV